MPVFSAGGTWVGPAEHFDAITDLIHTHESGRSADTT